MSRRRLKLVVDTSIIISALLRRRSVAYQALVTTEHGFFAPKYVFVELLSKIDLLAAESDLPRDGLLRRLLRIMLKVKVLEFESFSHKLQTAMNLARPFDVTDAPFVALFLALGADGILSYDKDYDKIGIRRFEPREL